MAITRDQIITAAIHHLNENPTLSMAQLAEAVGISRATLNRHFTSRDDLTLALGRRANEQWAQAQVDSGLLEATASGDPEAIKAALHALLAGLADVADEYGFSLTDHALDDHPELRQRTDELEEREVDFYAAAQRAGLLRADLPARWISNLVFGLLVAVRESLSRGDIARRDASRLVFTTFMHGAAVRNEDS
ncbi:TetR/AcrR family transcriptional regulator [Nonomuraea sp. NPDC050404]|uniref:TetR/AcrR family transcriptional regulator n=1 Tax=Nonomuraea sp. NPDC050404 TaxID=3155783 RepID=UPI003400676D